MSKSIRLERNEATRILKTIGVKIPTREEVESESPVWERILPTGAKVKVTPGKDKGKHTAMIYWLHGYAADGSDIRPYTNNC